MIIEVNIKYMEAIVNLKIFVGYTAQTFHSVKNDMDKTFPF